MRYDRGAVIFCIPVLEGVVLSSQHGDLTAGPIDFVPHVSFRLARLVLVKLLDYISRVNVCGHEGHNDLPLKLAQISPNPHDQLRELHDVRFVPPESNTDRHSL